MASIGDSPGGQTPLLPILDPASSTFSVLVFGYSELSESTGNFTECLVGQGSFGSVFMARVRGNGPYAIKKLHSVSYGEGKEGGGGEGVGKVCCSPYVCSFM